MLSSFLQVKALPPTGVSLTPLSPWILWNLWKARNLCIFEDRLLSHHDIIHKAIKEAGDWQAAQLSIPSLPQNLPSPATKVVPVDAFKCFVDAAWCGTSKLCGQGWIIFDPRGDAPIRSSSFRPWVHSALTAEALAMRSALSSLCRNSALSHIRKLEIFSDSQILISTINAKAHSKELKAILHDITCFSESFISINFNFVPRLGNLVADSLAKSALVAA
ncbi:unnamed protein product [Arabidopsis arenosa]|uniref:RNase H type-1 domain-containing protein n=1 Tax=Arabidopsis arenosa TaxID=38785 RepID=A0A8S1ZPP6_ARAAE|nr:unnamed protein product [Arabidopsis arenosa]